MDMSGKYLFIFISVFSIVAQLNAVKALCPTNKIAPHRRHANWEPSRGRTLGLIYDLFGPARPYRPVYDPLNDLQEQPQEDEQDDCGEIEDYDETDLSSITPGGNRRITNRNDRYLFGNNYSPPYNRGPRKHHRPTRPQRPILPQRPTLPPKPTRPPNYFGGDYTTQVNTPSSYYPPDLIKPVTEDTDEDLTQAPPLINQVGGILGNILGFPTVRPTFPIEGNRRRKQNSIHFPDQYSNRRPNRYQDTNKYTSIVGSFVDLFFK